MLTNRANQLLVIFASSRINSLGVEGLSESIECDFLIEGQEIRRLSQLHPNEIANGYYYFQLTAAEVQGERFFYLPICYEENVRVEVVRAHYPTVPLAGLRAAIDFMQADRYIDQTSVPWREVYVKKLSGNLENGQRLSERELYTIDGQPVNSINRFVAVARFPVDESRVHVAESLSLAVLDIEEPDLSIRFLVEANNLDLDFVWLESPDFEEPE